ncbi:MAG: hypothetical protein AMXMBFR75_28250 [Candidatus Hinthialibacteria bacterium]
MKLTLRGYYAILALTTLARNLGQENQTRLEEIAEQHPIPETFLLQIFQTLKRSGLIQSKRGAHGGFQLARSPESIRLSEIIESVEGEILPSPMNERGEGAGLNDTCSALDSFWKELRDRVKEMFDSYSLADVTERVHNRKEPMYYI